MTKSLGHISNPGIGDIHFILYFCRDTSTGRGSIKNQDKTSESARWNKAFWQANWRRWGDFSSLFHKKIVTVYIDEIRTLLRGASSSSCTVSDLWVFFILFDTLSCFDSVSSRDLKPVSPETQATNGHFQNYQKWSRSNGNYQNRRTYIFWLLVLSTKMETACVQMFRAVSGTNAAGCRRAHGGATVSNTE